MSDQHRALTAARAVTRYLMAAALALTIAVVDVPSARAAEPSDYVALGDSYSSGEGLAPYDPSTETGCHRSQSGYPGRLRWVGIPLLENPAFVACAGAVTADVLYDGVHPAQIDALTERTKIVTLTIGGNDLQFADVLKSCVYTSVFWAQQEVKGREGCRRRWNESVRDRLKFLKGKPSTNTYYPNQDLGTVLEGIRMKAPRAHIFVAGYPKLVGTEQLHPAWGCRVGTAARSDVPVAPLWISAEDARWIQDLSSGLNIAIQQTVGRARRAGWPVTYVDASTAFEEGHNLCERGRPWMNGVVLERKRNGDTGSYTSASFHPNLDGQRGYARAFEQAIRQLPAARISTSTAVFTIGQSSTQKLTTADNRHGSWRVTGTLPAGLRLVGNAIEGTATSVGQTPVTVIFTDALDKVARRRVTIVVTEPTTPVPDPLSATGLRWASGIDCPARDFCLATSGLPYASPLTGTSWSGPQGAPAAWNPFGLLRSPSQPSRAACLANTTCFIAPWRTSDEPGGIYQTSNGGLTWQRVLTDEVTMLSCAGLDYCVAIGKETFEYRGTSWEQLAAAETPSSPQRMRCVAAGVCVTVNHAQTFSEFRNGRWATTGTERENSEAAFNALACLNDGTCFAGASGWETAEGDAGSPVVFRRTEAGWEQEPAVLPDDGSRLVGLDCADSACVGLTDAGGTVLWQGTWRAGPDLEMPETDEEALRRLADLSCSTATDCHAIFGNGDVSHWDGSAWIPMAARYPLTVGEPPISD